MASLVLSVRTRFRCEPLCWMLDSCTLHDVYRINVPTIMVFMTWRRALSWLRGGVGRRIKKVWEDQLVRKPDMRVLVVLLVMLLIFLLVLVSCHWSGCCLPDVVAHEEPLRVRAGCTTSPTAAAQFIFATNRWHRWRTIYKLNKKKILKFNITKEITWVLKHKVMWIEVLKWRTIQT